MPSTEVLDSLQWDWASSKTRSTLQPLPEATWLSVHTGNCLPELRMGPAWLGESPAACSVLGQVTRVKERSPKAHPPCFQMHARATHKAPCPRHTLPEHKMVQTHSAFCPSQVAQQEPSGCHWTRNHLPLQKYSARHSRTISDVSCPEPQTFWTILVQWKVVGGRRNKHRIKIADMVCLRAPSQHTAFSLPSLLPSLLRIVR